MEPILLHLCKVLVRLGNGPFRRSFPQGRLHDVAVNVEVVKHLQLADVAALLAAAAEFRARVEYQPYILRTLDKAVEVVGPDGILILVCRQAESLSEFGGDERGGYRPAGEDALVAGEDYKIVEVQGAGFQGTHDLQSLKRFAIEGNAGATHELVEEAPPGTCLDVEVQALQTGDGLV